MLNLKMNFQMVEHDGINHIFPDTIPKKRSNRDVIAKLITSSITIAVGCCLTNFHYISIVCNYLFLALIELLVRICHLCEEIHHINSRYDKKKWILLTEVFSYNKWNTVLLPLALVTAIFLFDEFTNFIKEHGMVGLSFIGVYLISKIIILEENGIHAALLIENLKGLDYGTGMAHSFFHGYLKLILPQSCTEVGSVKQSIENYEANHNVKFETKKLYILIPLSAHCPSRINEISKKIEDGGESEEMKRDIACTRERSYRNSVYKLYPDGGGVFYVMAEYATPLRTLDKAISYNSAEAGHYKRYKKEIVTKFFNTLDRLVRNDPECCNYCHLIYFRDIDENGVSLKIDICDLIFQRILYDKQNERLL